MSSSDSNNRNENFASTVEILTDKAEQTQNTSKQQTYINIAIKYLIFAVITAYFAWATVYFTQTDFTITCNNYGFLVILYVFVTFGFFYGIFFEPIIFRTINKYAIKHIVALVKKILDFKYAKILVYCLIFAAILTYVVVDSWTQPQRLIPIGGLLVFLLFGFTFSKYRRQINWDIICRGMILQFIFGIITIRWPTGRNIFSCLGDKVTVLLDYSKDGAAFVYTNLLVRDNAIFAFSAITTIYFLSFLINILYHLGIMQKIVGNLGLVLHRVMGTSICESVNSAANIFLGQTEAPLLLKPYLVDLTASELHAIMVGGFASVSGTVLAAYISFGAEASNLITASVMAAPAGLVYSKLMFPEIEQTVATKESIELTGSEYASVLDAASQGASQATYIILGIIANLVAFIATVFFINGMLGWFGGLVGYSDPGDALTIEKILGYVFIPLAYILGVPWDECQAVAKLIGLKVMVNEFAAFAEFQNVQDSLTERTKTIATFAMCGFANPGSIGIVISTFSTLMPNKGAIVADSIFRAFVTGTVVCFTTACIAAILTVY